MYFVCMYVYITSSLESFRDSFRASFRARERSSASLSRARKGSRVSGARGSLEAFSEVSHFFYIQSS